MRMKLIALLVLEHYLRPEAARHLLQNCGNGEPDGLRSSGAGYSRLCQQICAG